MYQGPSSFYFYLLDLVRLICGQEAPLTHGRCSAATFHVTPPQWATWEDRYPSETAVPSPFLVQSSHVIHSHAKDEQVLFSGFLSHFHVGPIHGPDGQGAVQHKLHIACP